MIEIVAVVVACAVVGGCASFGIGCIWLAGKLPWNRKDE